MNYVRLTSSFGNWDTEFPLLEALRTKLGVPRPAAFDPERPIGLDELSLRTRMEFRLMRV